MANSDAVPRFQNIPLLKSCESCRQRKIKCSGEKPTCAHCARRHQPCIYRRSARYKRRLNAAGSASKPPQANPGSTTVSGITRVGGPDCRVSKTGNTAVINNTINNIPGGGIVGTGQQQQQKQNAFQQSLPHLPLQQPQMVQGSAAADMAMIDPVAIASAAVAAAVATGSAPPPSQLNHRLSAPSLAPISTSDVIAGPFPQSANASVNTSSSLIPSSAVTMDAISDDNIPLSTLFATTPINESDILPPSILQNMNLWMNDSLLTYTPPTPNSTLQSPQLYQQPRQTIPNITQFPSIPSNGPSVPSVPSMPSAVPQAITNLQSTITQQQNQQQQQQNQQHNLMFDNGINNSDSPLSVGVISPTFTTSNLIPMEAALALQYSFGDKNVSVNSSGNNSSDGNNNNNDTSPEGTAALVSQQAVPQILQQHNSMFGIPQNKDLTNQYSFMTMDSPDLNMNSNNHLDASSATTAPSLFSSSNITSGMIPLPINSLESLNMVNHLSNNSPQLSSLSLQNFQQQNNSSNLNGGLFLSSSLMANPSDAASAAKITQKLPALSGDMMQPSSAAAIIASTQSGESAASQEKRQNVSSFFMQADERIALNEQNTTVVNNIESDNSYVPVSSSAGNNALSSIFSPVTAPGRGIEQHQQQLSEIAGRITGSSSSNSSSSSANSSSEHLSSRRSSGANNLIPRMIVDLVNEYPELGSARLVYNLLITHVVHDCSRIGIYCTRLFWHHTKNYTLPRFYLFSAIADACRSWTLADNLRSALPQNLDEICYALAIKEAPTQERPSRMLVVQGLIMLSAYEFKSARFGPMIEHSMLALKMVMALKFRGSKFPWRGVESINDKPGLDSNYELLIRGFWRLYLSLYYSSEIFRIDIPDDPDFLPELPRHDEYFAQHTFIPNAEAEFGFSVVAPPYPMTDSGLGDLHGLLCELYIKQFKIMNRFNQVLRGEKSLASYLGYLNEWNRQMLEWRSALPKHLRDDFSELARHTQPLNSQRRKMDLEGLTEDEMWQRRQEWNQDAGRTMEVLCIHMLFDMTRIKAHRIGLMILLHEDLDMVRNFQDSKAFAVTKLPQTDNPITGSYEDDVEAFGNSVAAYGESAQHLYGLMKFSYQFGFDLHAYSTVIIGALLQIALVYIGRVQSKDTRAAWDAMLRLARILAMIRSLERWGPALYIFTNILKALGRPELILQVPSPSVRAQLREETRRPMFPLQPISRTESVTSSEGGFSALDGQQSSKRKIDEDDEDYETHGNEKRLESIDGAPMAASRQSLASGSPLSSGTTDDDDVSNPFPHDHVITHIMREQNVNTATFFSPTLPVLAATLLHNRSGVLGKSTFTQ